MSLKDWIIAGSQDPVLREIKHPFSKNKFKGHKVYLHVYFVAMWCYERRSCIGELHYPKKIGIPYNL